MKLTPHEEKILSLVKTNPEIITDSKQRAKVAKNIGLSEKTLRNRIGDLKKYGIIKYSGESQIEKSSVQLSDTDKEIDLNTAFHILNGRKWTIINFTGLVTLIGITYALLATPFYQSATSMYPAGEAGNPGSLLDGNLEGIAETFGIKGLSTVPTYNIPDIVNSRRLKKNIILANWKIGGKRDSLNLIQFWDLDQPKWLSPGQILKKFLPVNPYPADPLSGYLETAVEKLSNLVMVEEEISGLIIVSVLMEDPKLASDITNYIATFVKDFISNEQNKEAIKNKNFIYNQMISSKEDLAQTESKLTEFFKQNPLASGNPDLQMEQGRLTRDVEEKQAVYITLRQQYEIAKIEVEKDRLLVNVLDEAEPAIKETKPKRILLIVLSLFGGFSISAAWVLIRESSKPTQYKS
jgi:hypothetical protein